MERDSIGPILVISGYVLGGTIWFILVALRFDYLVHNVPGYDIGEAIWALDPLFTVLAGLPGLTVVVLGLMISAWEARKSMEASRAWSSLASLVYLIGVVWAIIALASGRESPNIPYLLVTGLTFSISDGLLLTVIVLTLTALERDYLLSWPSEKRRDLILLLPVIAVLLPVAMALLDGFSPYFELGAVGLLLIVPLGLAFYLYAHIIANRPELDERQTEEVTT